MVNIVLCKRVSRKCMARGWVSWVGLVKLLCERWLNLKSRVQANSVFTRSKKISELSCNQLGRVFRELRVNPVQVLFECIMLRRPL